MQVYMLDCTCMQALSLRKHSLYALAPSHYIKKHLLNFSTYTNTCIYVHTYMCEKTTVYNRKLVKKQCKCIICMRYMYMLLSVNT